MSARGSGWVRPGELPHSDRDTSLQAAKDAGSSAKATRTAILVYIRRQGAQGATDDEVERVLGYPHQTASARRRELVLAGWVQASGKKRPTRLGSPATVWVAVGPTNPEPTQEKLF